MLLRPLDFVHRFAVEIRFSRNDVEGVRVTHLVFDFTSTVSSSASSRKGLTPLISASKSVDVDMV